jgi:ankyrin repeat protein
MPPKRKVQLSAVELQQEHSQDQESNDKCARGAEGNDQQEDPGLDLDCKQSVNLPPPLQDDDPIITQFKPVQGQRGLTEDNIKRIDPETGYTILHNYCQHINTTPVEVYRLLIEVKGCDINAQDKYNDTPLYDAIYHFNLNKGGDITVLTYLLSQKGINGNIKDRNGGTLLHYACSKINKLPFDIFKVLIETMGCDVNAQDDDNNTPIDCALSSFDPLHGDINVLTSLLSQKGIDPNIKGQFGYTVLHKACQKINTLPIDVFKILIEVKGCDVNAQDKYKNTPIHSALGCFNTNWGGDINVLTYLLSQKGVNVNIKGFNCNTILHTACQKINTLPIEIFKFLIETMGCDINAQDNNSNTPLHDALRDFDPNKGGGITILTYLINQKIVDVNIKGYNDYTLLHRACIIYLSNARYDMKKNAECDDISCQIIELIAERCIQEVLDETTL